MGGHELFYSIYPRTKRRGGGGGLCAGEPCAAFSVTSKETHNGCVYDCMYVCVRILEECSFFYLVTFMMKEKDPSLRRKRFPLFRFPFSFFLWRWVAIQESGRRGAIRTPPPFFVFRFQRPPLLPGSVIHLACRFPTREKKKSAIAPPPPLSLPHLVLLASRLAPRRALVLVVLSPCDDLPATSLPSFCRPVCSPKVSLEKRQQAQVEAPSLLRATSSRFVIIRVLLKGGGGQSPAHHLPSPAPAPPPCGASMLAIVAGCMPNPPNVGERSNTAGAAWGGTGPGATMCGGGGGLDMPKERGSGPPPLPRGGCPAPPG